MCVHMCNSSVVECINKVIENITVLNICDFVFAAYSRGPPVLVEKPVHKI